MYDYGMYVKRHKDKPTDTAFDWKPIFLCTKHGDESGRPAQLMNCAPEGQVCEHPNCNVVASYSNQALSSHVSPINTIGGGPH